MATEIPMPQLGETVVEGTISKWLRQVGDKVEEYDPLVEIVTDKVTVELPSPVSGTITEIRVKEGEVVKVGTVLAVIQEVGASTNGGAAKPKAAEEPVPAAAGARVAQATAEAAPESGGRLAEEPVPGAAGARVAQAPAQAAPESGGRLAEEPVPGAAGARVAQAPIEAAPESGGRLAEEPEERRATPAVRRMARELKVDLARVQGTGPGGRITREDVENFNRQPAQAPGAPAQAPAAQPAPAPAPAAQPAPAPSPAAAAAPSPDGGEAIPLSPVRRMIAEHMMRSKTEIPHALTVQEVDMTAIVRFRDGVREQYRQREGMDLSFVAFVAKAVVEAMKEHPVLNSIWTDEKIVLKKEINIGVAVAVQNGLIVPVIHGADGLSIAGLNRAVNDLANRARANKLAINDVQGGTFTVNNTGAFGSVIGYPIINHPQAAIMNMEAIVKRPVVIDDAIAIRSIMNLCLSFDHRIMDGAVAGRFLGAVRKWLEGFTPNIPLY